MPLAPLTLSTKDPGFEAAFKRLLDAKREPAADVDAAVAEIIADVARRGDDALLDYTSRFDEVDLTQDRAAAVAAGKSPRERLRRRAETVAALRLAAERIESFHRRQLPAEIDYVDELGVRLAARWRPIDAVGLYVPGGTAAYPSSVLMNAIPAKVAGVARVVMTVPAPGGVLNPLVLAAAQLLGIDEIYRVGGAQAVAALAYGTADDRAGRQDRRAGQRLCRGGEAAGLRPRRDRHDRRPIGDPGRRRCGERTRNGLPPIFCRRPSTTSRRRRS